MLGTIIGAVIGALLFGFIIWLISKLNIGLRVDSFAWAITLGIFISAFSSAIQGFFAGANPLIAAIIGILVTAVVISVSGRLKGIHVNGFNGALLAAIAIGVVQLVIILLAQQLV